MNFKSSTYIIPTHANAKMPPASSQSDNADRIKEQSPKFKTGSRP
jgi:hypothetical protein